MDYSQRLPEETWREIFTTVASLGHSLSDSSVRVSQRWGLPNESIPLKPSSTTALTCSRFYDLISPLRFSSFTINTQKLRKTYSQRDEALYANLEEKIDFLIKNPKICNQIKEVKLSNCSQDPIPESFWSRLLPSLNKIEHLDVATMDFGSEKGPANLWLALFRQSFRTLKKLTIRQEHAYGLSLVFESLPHLKGQLRLSEIDLIITDPDDDVPCGGNNPTIGEWFPPYFGSKAANERLDMEKWDVWDIIRTILGYPKDFQSLRPTKSMSRRLERLKENNYDYYSEDEGEDEDKNEVIEVDASGRAIKCKDVKKEGFDKDEEGPDKSKGVLRFVTESLLTCNALHDIDIFMYFTRIPSHLSMGGGLPTACCADTFEFRIPMFEENRIYLDEEEVKMEEFLSYPYCERQGLVNCHGETYEDWLSRQMYDPPESDDPLLLALQEAMWQEEISAPRPKNVRVICTCLEDVYLWEGCNCASNPNNIINLPGEYDLDCD